MALAQRREIDIVLVRTATQIRPSRPKVLTLVAAGRSYRLIGREVGLSKNKVAEIVKRTRAEKPASPAGS
jgi:hypothetical protein